MVSPHITFMVFAYNEEQRLELMLNLLRPHGRIIVFDNHSTDRTAEIARTFTDHVYQHQNLGYCESERTMAFAWSKVETKWAYLLYVDEFIPRELMELLKEVAAGDRYDAVEIYRRNFMYGREVFNYGKHHLRMFTRDSVDFTGNIVHKLGAYRIAPDRVLRVPKRPSTTIWHFGSYNTARLELAHNRYANLEAGQRHEMLGQKFSGSRAIFKLLFYFFGTYFGLGGFRGGWPGFFVSVQIAYFKFSIECRLWEFDTGLTPERIEEQYDVLKRRLIEEYAATHSIKGAD